jgi:hypothetical protein
MGIKNPGTEALDNTRDWIADKYKSYGYTQIEFDTFIYQGDTLQNIIIEKPGLNGNDWIVIGAHYDSYVQSTGTNDNGSGVIACLQIAKIVKDIETERSIRFIHFSAEENGLVGSKHYVANTLNPSDQVYLMLNLDQLGGSKDKNNSRIVCERDESNTPPDNNEASSRITDTLALLIQNYTFLEPVIERAFSSDYIPFEDSGYVITGLYQDSNDPFNHSDQDLLSNMDTEATHQVIQGALAAAMYFGKHTLPLGLDDKKHVKTLNIYPNPASGSINIQHLQTHAQLVITDLNGRVVWTGESSGPVDVSNLKDGIYFLEIYTLGEQIIQRTKLIIAENF